MNNPMKAPLHRLTGSLGLLCALALLAGCQTMPRPGAFAPRKGDEIVVAGQLVHTGARVVTWMDPGGYDAYRVERRFSPLDESSWEKSKETVKDLSSPNRYSLRRADLSDEQVEKVRGGGWDLPLLRNVVDQFVLVEASVADSLAILTVVTKEDE